MDANLVPLLINIMCFLVGFLFIFPKVFGGNAHVQKLASLRPMQGQEGFWKVFAIGLGVFFVLSAFILSPLLAILFGSLGPLVFNVIDGLVAGIFGAYCIECLGPFIYAKFTNRA